MRRCDLPKKYRDALDDVADGRKVPGLLIFELAGLGLVEAYNPPVLSESGKAAQRGYEFTPAVPPPSVR